MNQKMRMISGGQGLGPIATPAELEESFAGVQLQPPLLKSAWTNPDALQVLEKMKVSLVLAYLSSNLSKKNIPLKVFMDGFEKKILLACLRLTQGNQKNAAALLCLKPTGLFEKMRKHGIRSQRGGMPGEPCVYLAAEGDN
jgi:DNA-binding NtrC family response regulator